MATELTTRFDEAFTWARELHSSQLRKSTEIPYMAHLMSVSALVLEHGGTEDEAIAGLLHDAVEDQDGDPILAEIRTRFGDAVAQIVAGCTDAAPAKGQPKPPWKQRKQEYIDHVAAETNRSVVLVSGADKVHNARAILADYGDIGEELWSRFNAPREDTLWYYAELVEAFGAAEERFNALGEEPDHYLGSLLNRLEETVEELHLLVEVADIEEMVAEMNPDDFDDEELDDELF